MIQIKECIVWWFRPTKFGLNINLHIKQEDLTKEEKDRLEEYRRDGTSLVGVLQEFQKTEKTEEEKTRFKRMIILMQEYCNRNYIQKEHEKERIYEKYNVKSRTELSLQQIEELISQYEADNFSK